MKGVFADTSYFAALLIPNDKGHAIAVHWLIQAERLTITSEYVLVELGNFLCHKSKRHRFIKFMTDIEGNTNLRIVRGTPDLFARAMDLYAARSDKSWSFTDCTSFVVMRDEGLTEALSFDKHFEQAGFSPILK